MNFSLEIIKIYWIKLNWSLGMVGQKVYEVESCLPSVTDCIMWWNLVRHVRDIGLSLTQWNVDMVENNVETHTMEHKLDGI